MTKTEANKKARELWGRAGRTEKGPPDKNKKGQVLLHPYRVGYTLQIDGMPLGFSIQGHGNSWEEAFHKAEPRKTKQPLKLTKGTRP